LLRFIDNTRSNQSYVEELLFHTGTLASESFISDCFANRFDHSGKFKVGCLVPWTSTRKRTLLVARYFEYCQFIQAINDPSRLKFGDEKHLDGADLYKRKMRHNPVTGEVNGILVEGGLRDRFNINAIIGLDHWTPTNRLFLFLLRRIQMMRHHIWRSLFLLCYPVISIDGIYSSIDNRTGHLNAEVAMLEDLLWNYVRMLDLMGYQCVYWSSPSLLVRLNSILLSSSFRFLYKG